jgi:hypothetical protein
MTTFLDELVRQLATLDELDAMEDTVEPEKELTEAEYRLQKAFLSYEAYMEYVKSIEGKVK